MEVSTGSNQGVTMTNVRLRIEDANPAVASGAFGVTLFSGATTVDGRPSTKSRAAYRHADRKPAKVEAE
jgi:hypothetical protein